MKAGPAAARARSAIGEAINERPVIHLDDTWMRTVDPGADKTHQSRLWGDYADAEPSCYYQRRRVGRWPAEFLAGYRGTLMADAYAGHHRHFADGQMTPAACMAHTWRKCEDALDAAELLATKALDHFALFDRIERETAGQTPDQRLCRRQAKAVPILDRLEALVIDWETDPRRSSGLFRAAHDTRTISPNLRTYTIDGRIPVDNNDLVRLWRQASRSRNNSLFAGSARGGDWAATMSTICQCCRLVELDPLKYLVEIIAESHTGRTDDIHLRPKAWAETAEGGRIPGRSRWRRQD